MTLTGPERQGRDPQAGAADGTLIGMVDWDGKVAPSARAFASLLAVLFGGSAGFAFLGGWAGVIGIAVVMAGTVITTLALM